MDFKGKCCDCEDVKSLDEMIKKERGLYHCKTCVTDDVNNEYDPFDYGINEFPIRISKVKKLFRWCFG